MSYLDEYFEQLITKKQYSEILNGKIVNGKMMGAFLWLLLAAISFCGMVDVAEFERVSSGDWFVYLVVGLLSLCKASLLMLAVRFVWRMKSGMLRRALRVALWTFIAVYSLLCLANAFSFCFYGFGISLRMMNILLHTNVRETMEYLPAIASGLWGILPYVAASALFSFALGWGIKKLSGLIGRKAVVCCRSALYLATFLCLSLYILRYETGRNAVFVCLRTAKAFVQVRQSNARAAELASKPIVLPKAETIKCDERVDNFVLVIGESADRRHCSAYGYPLPTNRHTMQLSDSLIWFADAKAPYCGTDESLTRLLTFMDDGPQTDISQWFEYPNVVSVMKQAGYRCYWLSNQQRLGNYVDCTTVIGGLCDKHVWLQDYDYDALLASHDGALLPHIDQALSDTCRSRFVVVHLMGAHPEYRKRFPQEAAVFSASDARRLANKATTENEWQIVADYDNAMLYADSIVAEIMKRLFRQPGRNVLVYLSDHGQNVFDTSAHYGHDGLHLEIPLVIYLSESWRQANPERTRALLSHRKQSVVSSDLIHTILGLANVRYALCADSLDLSSSASISMLAIEDEGNAEKQ